MDKLMEEFLRRILEYGGAATSQECHLATRERDRARQKCRRLGYVVFGGGYWRITESGREAIDNLPPSETHKLAVTK